MCMSNGRHRVTELVVAAGGRLVGLAERVGDRWAQPALGAWDVRALAGHTARAFLTIESYVVPGSSAGPGSMDALGYYRASLLGGVVRRSTTRRSPDAAGRPATPWATTLPRRSA